MRHASRAGRPVGLPSGLALAGLVLAIGAVVARPGPGSDGGSLPTALAAGVVDSSVVTVATPTQTLRAAPALRPVLRPVLRPDEIPARPRSVPSGSAPLAREAKEESFEPTSIRLPSGRTAPIQPAAVRPDGALDVPADPERIGWWTGGAQAGEPFGSIVLAGHVDSARYGIGVLAAMLTMRIGQDVKLADGEHGQTYRVQTIRQVPKADLSAETALFRPDLEHRLVMITCGGPFDRRTHRYRDNLVIVATPVG